MKPRFLKFSYFAWLVVPAGLWLTYQLFGLPHLIWSYKWIDSGQGMSPFAQRTYTRCRFVGPYGEFDIPARGGQCAWVRFVKEEPR